MVIHPVLAQATDGVTIPAGWIAAGTLFGVVIGTALRLLFAGDKRYMRCDVHALECGKNREEIEKYARHCALDALTAPVAAWQAALLRHEQQGHAQTAREIASINETLARMDERTKQLAVDVRRALGLAGHGDGGGIG